MRRPSSAVTSMSPTSSRLQLLITLVVAVRRPELVFSRKFTFNSMVVVRYPGASKERAARKNEVSASMATRPPWTCPAACR